MRDNTEKPQQSRSWKYTGNQGAETMAMSLRIPVVVQARLISGALLFVAALPAQILMQGSGPAGAVRIFNTDSAILESQEQRKDLP
jgi:hypothetical protein